MAWRPLRSARASTNTKMLSRLMLVTSWATSAAVTGRPSAQVMDPSPSMSPFLNWPVYLRPSGQIMLPAGKTTADFVKMVTPFASTAPPVAGTVTLPAPMISGSSFSKVYPGSTLQFQVSAGNDFMAPLDRPQVFRATIKVQAGGCADLDERVVIVLIPPRVPRIG